MLKTQLMNIHFVGIGGIGISALAQFCFQRGDTVSGSNLGSNKVFKMLEAQGLKNLSEIHDPQNLSDQTDLLVYSEAIAKDNPERQKAQELGINEKSYFEFLGDISHNFTTIAVAGTHGKTTTTGLIAAGLQACDFDATIFVGSTLDILDGKNFYQGSNNYLVLEACEYRENFKFLKPDILLITNIEWDHADYFKTEDQYFEAFKKLAKKSHNIIFHQNDQTTKTLIKDLKVPQSLIPPQPEKAWSDVLQIFGEANYQNAALALGLSDVLKLDTGSFKAGLSRYKGAGRRQESLGLKNGLQVFDDYGHHPTEIKVTIQGFREKFPNAQIGLIFEPHQYSRTHQFFAEFAESFKLADHTALYPIYEARDTATDKAAVCLQDFCDDNPDLNQVSSLKEIENFSHKLNQNDVLLFMGAGNISQVAHQFINA